MYSEDDAREAVNLMKSINERTAEPTPILQPSTAPVPTTVQATDTADSGEVAPAAATLEL